MTSSTVSSESAPRSSTNEDSFLISASLTPSCSATIFLTRCSMFSMLLLPEPGMSIQNPAILPEWPAGLAAGFGLCNSGHVHPAVDVQRHAGDVGGLVRREKGHGVGDVLRRA